MKRLMTFLVIIILAGLAIYNNVQSKGSADQLPKVGFTAPVFTLKGMDQQATYKVEGKREKPLLLNFWASWCGPCKQEAPDLVRLYEKYKDQIDFYAVNITANDQPEQAAAFVKQYGLSFPILMDETGEVSTQYEIVSIPTTYFIDKNGIIRQKVIGLVKPEVFEEYLEELQ